MAKKLQLDECRTRKDFLAYVKQKGGHVKEGGNHDLISGPISGRPVPLGRHPGELSKGLRRAIAKELKLIGLAVIVLGIVLNQFM